MHELSIIGTLVDRAVAISERNGIKKVAALYVTIGELRDFQNEWLDHFFGICKRDTILSDAVLVVTPKPIVVECAECGKQTHIPKEKLPELPRLMCMDCGSDNVKLISGREVLITGILPMQEDTGERTGP